MELIELIVFKEKRCEEAEGLVEQIDNEGRYQGGAIGLLVRIHFGKK